jgi:hypothetical protein
MGIMPFCKFETKNRHVSRLPNLTTFSFRFPAYSLGLILGIAVSSVMMNVVKGAVNTLIVCFADAPAKLHDNHPQAARDIAESWSAVFPDVVIRPAPYRAVV